MSDFEVGKQYVINYKLSETWADFQATPWKATTAVVVGEVIADHPINILVRTDSHKEGQHVSILKSAIFEAHMTAAQWIADLAETFNAEVVAEKTVTADPSKHCFCEDSPTKECRDCGNEAIVHTGCDCEPDKETAHANA